MISRLIIVLLLIGLAPGLHAAPATAPAGGDEIQSLESSLKEAEGAAKPDADLIGKLRTRLEAIRHEQQRLQQAQARIEAARLIQRDGQKRLDRLIAKSRESLPMPVLAGLDVEHISGLLQQTIADEQAVQERLEASVRARTEVEQRSETLRQASLAAPPAAPAPPPPGEAPLLARAGKLLAGIRQQANEAESQALALEQATQPLALQLARATHQLAQHELEQLHRRREQIEAALNARRLAEAQATQQSASIAAQYQSHPLLKRLAEDNQGWADRLSEMTQRLGEVTRQREDAARRTEAMREDMATLKKRLEQLGLGPVIGNLLLEERADLPSDAQLARRIKDNRTTVGDIQLLDLDLAHEQQVLAAPLTLISQLLLDTPEEEQARLTPDIQRLLKDREDILQRLDAIKPPLLLAVDDLEFALESQRRAVRDFSGFIAQNLLWMPNARPLWRTSWADYRDSVLALLNLRGVWDALHQTVRGLSAHSWTPTGFALLFIGLLAIRPRLRARIRELADRPFGQRGETLWTTLGAIGLVGLFALPWPVLVAGIGFRLRETTADGGLAEGLGQAMILIAPLLLYARASLSLFHPNGLAERHFGWSPQTLETLRRAMHLFIGGVLPLGFVAALAITMDTEAMRDGTGRLSFMLTLTVLAVMFGRLLHPRGGIILHWRMTHPRHWSVRLAPLWFALGVGLPILFAALAAVGYFYSAGILTQKLVTSLWLALALAVVYDFGLRALRLAQRRLESQREQAAPPPPRIGGEGEGMSLVPLGMDVDQISLQSRKLLNFSMVVAMLFALYAVWAPILPALGFFDQILLWDYRGEIKGELVTVSVSLGDLLLSLLMLFTMWMAARNLPGLMEILLERWTGQDAGTRYATITITRYIIIAIGLVLILGGLGLQWSQMQWMVAALGVGLGFGLQEIFANFISGLIILFERPVRVGDLVSIGDQTGHIKKIHIRATVLEDYDRREIIVPNKKLITEQVTNWTLSDTSTRVLLDVGVAYGTDPREVEAILVEAAHSVEDLLPDPPPLVWFMGFGDSALNFRLRAFVADADNKLGTTSELHYAIEKALRDHGISIPFPQRDIHIRDISGLNQKLFQEPKPT